MKLYFLRHGVAYDRETWQGDNDDLRPLTEEGIATMKCEAKYIQGLNLKLDAIITSPLNRAYHTAKIVAKRLDMEVTVSDLLKPGFDLAALETLATEYPQYSRLMIIGHEPDFSRTIGALIGGGDIIMRKGGLAKVDVPPQHPSHGRLVWILTPALMKG